MDYEVLLGFKNKIKKNKIKIIQFEYGYSNSLSKYMLADFFNFFYNHRYLIGKLTQNGVIFIDTFNILLNDFKSGPNFIAVPKKYKNFIIKLSKF